MFFFNTHWPQLTAPFYSIHFETSICQFNSSKFSSLMPDEVRETMRLDQSFIQNHSRSFRCTAPCWFILLFRFPYSFSTRFRSEDWNGHREAWFYAQWPIFVFGLLFGWKIQTWPIVRFLTKSVTYWFFICWYLIESMCLNKMSIPVFTKPLLSVCC